MPPTGAAALPPEVAALLGKGGPGKGAPPADPSGGKGVLIAKALQILAGKGVLPQLAGKGGAAPPAPNLGKGPAAPAMPPQLALPLFPASNAGGNAGAAASTSDPFLKEVRSFIERWDLEHRFEPKLVSYLKRDGAPPLKEEMQRLDKELNNAGVPPVCRSGYLLVVFGDVTEKSTDEDFRLLLTGKSSDAAMERDQKSPSPSRPERSGPATDGAGAPEKKSNVPSVPPLSEQWMMDEIGSAVSRFKLDDTVRNRFINAMRRRTGSFKEDMATLNDVMRAHKHPKGALSLKLREMERGTFSARSYSPLGPTPAERQDMERAAKAAAAGGDKDGEKDKDKEKEKSKDKDRDKEKDGRDGSRDRKRSRSRRRRSRSRSRSRRR